MTFRDLFPPLAVVGLSVASACRSPRPIERGAMVSAREVEQVPDSSAKSAGALGPGDLIDIKVYQEVDLTGAYRVSIEGTIDFPLCGKVAIAGQTSSRVADMITECLSRGYLKNPQVSVLLRESNSKKVFVFGEVQKPGTFAYDDNMSIIQAITIAGGFTKTAAKNNANVTRLVAGQEKKIRVAVEDIGVGREPNFLLKPGDIVFVPESFF